MSSDLHPCKIGERIFRCYQRVRGIEDGIYYLAIYHIDGIEASFLGNFLFGEREYDFYYSEFTTEEEKIKIDKNIIEELETIQEGDFIHSVQ
jgi:hypothetical protein